MFHRTCLNFREKLSTRTCTKYIVIHHELDKGKTCPEDNFPMHELLERIKVQKKRFIQLYGDPKDVDYSFLLKFLE